MRILLAATSTAFAILVFGLAMRFEASLQPANPGQSKAAEEAKVEQSVVPRGWSKTGYPGVFYRWCEKKDNCSDPNNDIPRLEGQMEVWCRDKSCDLYVQANWKDENGRIVGQTNDTGKGLAGEKVILKFPSYEGNAKTIQITDFRSD
jgi:hypothetical protein